MHDLVEFLDCVDAHAHFVLSYLGALDVGIFYVFCALFRLPNVGQGYNYITLFVYCNSLSANLSQLLVPLWKGLHGPPPCHQANIWDVLSS